MTDKNKKRIFLSYSYHDRDKAYDIANRLKSTGFEVVLEYKNILPGENILDEIKYLFQTSDFVLILLSKALFDSTYFKFEYTQDFFQETQKRKVTLIPVLIEKCKIPSDFLSYEIFNLTIDYDKVIEKLIDRIRTIPEISFDKFASLGFEELVYDVLRAYGFINIQRDARFVDRGIDFVAEFITRNPFGQKRKEAWMIETRFYSESRVDIKTVRQLVELYKYANERDAKILLITNGQLTSVVEEYLDDLRKNSQIHIEVVDGLLLKKLIAKRKGILNKYFLK